jgi:hypothetical protein
MAALETGLALLGTKVDEPVRFTNRMSLVVFVAYTSNLPPDHPKVKAIVDKLFPSGTREVAVSFRPVFYSNKSTGVVQFPLYGKHVLYNFGKDRSGNDQILPDVTFVDDSAREYSAKGHSAFKRMGRNE